MSETTKKPLLSAGDIDIELLKLVSSNGFIIDLYDYLIELNIFEDIFSPSLHGSILVSDSRNLIKEMNICGEETLIVKLTTPTMPSSIEKVFRVYSVSDRTITSDLNTQTYLLSFCSQESILDSLTPLYNSFEGKITDVITKIFTKHFNLPKTFDLSGQNLVETAERMPLYIINDTANKVKFVSPGWTPFKCINWLASKSIPREGGACNYLFWESSKAFYFGSIEGIFQRYKDKNIVSGHYKYNISNIREANNRIGPNLAREFFIVSEFDIPNQTDKISQYSSGHLASQLTQFDINRKSIRYLPYDHVDQFKRYSHSEPNNPAPIFKENILRTPRAKTEIVSKNSGLFSGFVENVSEKTDIFWSNRLSNLQDISQFKMNIVVPGRTDLEAGTVIRFSYPDVSPKDNTDIAKSNEDPYFSGYYLVTAIRHKISLLKHVMIVEIVKDSFTTSTT